MKVREVMVREIKSFLPDDNVGQALESLEKMHISGLPVIDNKGKLVGMFTEKDVLLYILPSYVEKVGKFIYEDQPKSVKKKIMELNKLAIKDLMRKDVITVDEDTALCEVARVMLTQKARRLPVLDKAGKVIGIVARCDVLKALIEEAKADH